MVHFTSESGEARITFINRCNARCTTCLMSTVRRPKELLTWPTLRNIIEEIKTVPQIKGVSFYSIGESYLHPEFVAMAEWAIAELMGSGIVTTIVSNGALISKVPTGLDNLWISFNAGKRETYERVTGICFDDVVENIHHLYCSGELNKAKDVQIHMLVFNENEMEIDSLRMLFREMRGVRLRLNRKFDNQHGELSMATNACVPDRLPCDYVTHRLTFYSNGELILCPHDFEGSITFGNIGSSPLNQMLSGEKRREYFQSHLAGDFQGLCQHCDYNTPRIGNMSWQYFHSYDRRKDFVRTTFAGIRRSVAATPAGKTYRAIRDRARRITNHNQTFQR